MSDFEKNKLTEEIFKGCHHKHKHHKHKHHKHKYDWKELDFFLNNVKNQLNLKKICFLKNNFLSNKTFDNYLILYEYMNKKIHKLNFDIPNLKFNKNFAIFLADENNIPFYYNNVFLTIQNKIVSSNQSNNQTRIIEIFTNYLRNFNNQYTPSQLVVGNLNKVLSRKTNEWRNYFSNKWLLSSIYLPETLYKSSSTSSGTITIGGENTLTFEISDNGSLGYQTFNNNGYSAIIFTNNSSTSGEATATLTFSGSPIPQEAQSLFIAGGGSSSYNYSTASSSGGGGGGFAYNPLTLVLSDIPGITTGYIGTSTSPEYINISIGFGATRSNLPGTILYVNGNDGGNTIFSNLICYGGKGGNYDTQYGGVGGGTNLDPSLYQVGNGGDGGNINSTPGEDAILSTPNGTTYTTKPFQFVSVPFYPTNPTNIYIAGGGAASYTPSANNTLNLGNGGNGYGGTLTSSTISSQPNTSSYNGSSNTQYSGYAYGGGAGSEFYIYKSLGYNNTGSGAPGVAMVWFPNTIS